jgi:hypothetical protein
MPLTRLQVTETEPRPRSCGRGDGEDDNRATASPPCSCKRITAGPDRNGLLHTTIQHSCGGGGGGGDSVVARGGGLFVPSKYTQTRAEAHAHAHAHALAPAVAPTVAWQLPDGNLAPQLAQNSEHGHGYGYVQGHSVDNGVGFGHASTLLHTSAQKRARDDGYRGGSGGDMHPRVTVGKVDAHSHELACLPPWKAARTESHGKCSGRDRKTDLLELVELAESSWLLMKFSGEPADAAAALRNEKGEWHQLVMSLGTKVRAGHLECLTRLPE